MTSLLKLISLAGLLLTVVPSILVYTQSITLESHKSLMLFGMFLWFFSAPFWMKEKTL